MHAVQDFLMSKPQLRLSSSRKETLKKNSIFLMELHVPKKGNALKTLDKGHAKPKREARVVVTFGDQLRPNITEYIVGPLPKPTYYKHRTFKGKPPKFESRPISQMEYHHVTNKLQEITKKVYRILVETTGFSFHNCTDRCLTFSDIAPRGLESGERRTWIMLQKFVEGYFIHPIGFELLLNHKSLDPAEWEVEKVWYNDQYFDSVEELVEKYEKGEVTKMKLPDHDDDDLYSTYIPRGESSTRANIQGPKLVQPQGPRYRVERNFVEYAGWSFAFRVRSSAGLQLFDLRFNGERVAYEISLQEAVAFYSGSTPAAMQTKYIDAGWGMGTEDFELASGIDCPEIATFLDLYHYYDTDRPVLYKNALCIFEMTTGVPLRRHFNSNFKGGYNFYGGLENNVLVIRTTSTVYNYDYIWDFLFYQNGVMEAKVSATGYIHATFFTPEGLNHGARVYSYVLGNLHTHLVNYKVDLDIAGIRSEMWCHFLIFLAAVSTAGATCHQKREPAGQRGSIFADLTADEMHAVRDFLMSKPQLRLSSSRKETLKKNSIFLMELHVPKKGNALKTLDKGHAKPKREARVVVTFGDQLRPNITEYTVGPLPKPTYYKRRTFKGKPPKFESRPISQMEYHHVTNKLQEITKKVYRILVETTGFSFHNCTDRCLTFSDIAPRGLESGERRTWIMLQKFVEGYFIHPIGFELLLNHKSLDPAEWEVEKVWYNDQYFDSVEELVEKYEKGEVTKMKLPDHDDDDLYSTYIPRGESSTRANVQGPKLVQPQGPRYRVERNFVEYAGWSFAFRVRSSAGLQLFDLRFNGERVAYEISLQEAVAFYSGSTPAAMQTKYIDAGWGMGTEDFELASGIDCPEIATFLDLYHYYDTDRPVLYKNALCIFEMTTGVPLRRHFNSNFKGGYNFYGGLENNVLVIRTTSTVYNYDYIWDFLFYQNGRTTEREAAFPFGKHLPRYLHFYNPTKKNRWGHHKGYRIQFNSHAYSVLPQGWKEEVGITWSRYPLAVTRQKDSEMTSSTIYTQNDPWEPVVSFEDYIRDNENIDKTDLVAWVTVGFLHIPHSEDIPNTSTPGNSVGFFLRPFNFFDEDPSVASRDTVIVRPHKNSFSKVDTDRWTPELAGYCLSNKPFHYNGTYREV
ncbi:UNVERIFIED_CONTAM: hypothetical protein FKN15_002936 [Acipenser sinensis]